jgi:hypothetical protein
MHPSGRIGKSSQSVCKKSHPYQISPPVGLSGTKNPVPRRRGRFHMFAAEARSRHRIARRRRRPHSASRSCLKSFLRTWREEEPAPSWERSRRVERSVAAASRALWRPRCQVPYVETYGWEVWECPPPRTVRPAGRGHGGALSLLASATGLARDTSIITHAFSDLRRLPMLRRIVLP